MPRLFRKSGGFETRRVFSGKGICFEINFYFEISLMDGRHFTLTSDCPPDSRDVLKIVDDHTDFSLADERSEALRRTGGPSG
jgi:hypothetical protein